MKKPAEWCWGAFNFFSIPGNDHRPWKAQCEVVESLLSVSLLKEVGGKQAQALTSAQHFLSHLSGLLTGLPSPFGSIYKGLEIALNMILEVAYIPGPCPRSGLE